MPPSTASRAVGVNRETVGKYLARARAGTQPNAPTGSGLNDPPRAGDDAREGHAAMHGGANPMCPRLQSWHSSRPPSQAAAFGEEILAKLAQGLEAVRIQDLVEPTPTRPPATTASGGLSGGGSRTAPCRSGGWRPRRQANELTRPHGHRRPAPAQSSADRTPITTEERNALTAALATHRQKIRDVTNDGDPAKVNHVRRLQRRALRRALLDLGLVTITPRAITLPFKLHKAAKIS